jgi:predicted negative regulator of RcsB-dependent stress response
MSPIDLNAKFPELRPIRSVPRLWSVNGCGLLFHGRRDSDEETGSYIQSHCVCLLGIPILALGAYRVAEADDGKYILGREPLSIRARAFNAMVLLVVLGLGGYYGWSAYTRTPAYIARQKLEQADRLASAGKVAEAARLCQEIAQGPGPSDRTADAVRRVNALLDHPAARASAAEQAGVLQVAAALRRTGHWSETPEALYARGKAMMGPRGSTDPLGALAILEVIAPLAPKGDDLNAVRRGLLEPQVAAHPDDPELVSRLATVYESQGQVSRAVAMLEPLRARLGTTEGARILGLADVRRGRVDPALDLLRPYTRARLESFQAAETALTSAFETARKRVFDQLKAGPPPDFSVDDEDYLKTYLVDRIKADPVIDQAQQLMLRESSVVPVALELGLILVEHAQGQTDPKSRKDELDEAEKVFLAVGRLAGQNDTYRLNLARVYYWQGKHGEGRALFDEVLKAQKRDPKLLVTVGELLRQVGSQVEARALAEEAHKTGRDPETRQSAATLRGLLGIDLDDKIRWLGRGNPTDPTVKAILSSDLADQALNRGDEAKALAHLREAIGIYDAMPEASATLNNAALVLFRLAALTGDPAAYDRGLAKIETAHKLDPSDSVTMSNAGSLSLQAALREIIGTSIDLRLLKEAADIDMLPFLYRDKASRSEYAQRLRSHPGINRAAALLDKVIVLAPRSSRVYRALDELYGARGEPEKRRGLLQRLEHADLDQSDEIAMAKDVYAGGRKEERRTKATTAIARAESALEAARARKRDLTFAVAAANLAKARMDGYHAGLEADADAIVALAEEAHAAAPSYQTRHSLAACLLFRAGRRLAHAQPAYARMAERTRLSTSDRFLIGVAVNGEDPLRAAARQDSDVRRAVDRIREGYRLDPEYEADPWTWSLLHALDPQEGTKMARTYLEDESAQLSIAIERKVEPVSASAALSAFWAAEMAGKSADGRAILKEYAARGVPLPIESP